MKDPETASGVAGELQEVEQEAAQLAEEYRDNSEKGLPMDTLARATNGLLEQLNSIKSTMRQSE